MSAPDRSSASAGGASAGGASAGGASAGGASAGGVLAAVLSRSADDVTLALPPGRGPGAGAPVGLHLWGGPPDGGIPPGHVVAATSTDAASEEALDLARTCAAAGATALLLRRPAVDGAAAALLRLAADTGLGVLWLRPGRPWLPVLAALGSALEAPGAPAAAVGAPPDGAVPTGTLPTGADPAGGDPAGAVPAGGDPSGTAPGGVDGSGGDPLADVPLGDLFALADALTATVGGPVILEDAAFRVLAYSAFVGEMDRGRSEAILGRRIPDPWLAHLRRTGALERLRTGGGVVELTDGPWRARRRLIAAVNAGGRQVGVVWVAEPDALLPPGAAAVLARAVHAAAPHFVRHLELSHAAAARQVDLVHALLGGGAASARAATELGLSPRGAFAVLAATAGAVGAPGTEPATRAAAADEDPGARLVDHLGLCCEALRWPCDVVRSGRTVLGVLAVPPAADPAGLDRLVREVVRPAGAGPLAEVRVGVSTTGTGVPALPRLRGEALAALGVLEDADAPPGLRWARFDQVEARVVVRELAQAVGPRVRLSGLDRLAAHDARTGSGYTATLRAYLRAAGGVAETAAALGVHPTTLRYRLARITEVSGLRPAEADVRTACDVLLRRDAWVVAGTAGPAGTDGTAALLPDPHGAPLRDGAGQRLDHGDAAEPVAT